MRLLKTVLNKKDEVIDQLKVEKGSIENELETVKKNSKDSVKIVKVKEKEILNLQKENCQILESLEAAKKDLQDLKLRVNKEKKDLEKKLKKDENKDFMKNLLPSQVNQFQCNNCDVKMESVSKLKEHSRIFHMHTSGTQTNEIVLVGEATQCSLFKLSDDKGVQVEELVTEEEFEKYPCHYCNINIANEYHLREHRIKCRGTQNLYTEVGLPPKPYGHFNNFSLGFFPGTPGFCPPHGMPFFGLSGRKR